MRNKDDYLLLSQLTQAGYCLRRAALIMNEQLWQESADTAKGRFEHDRVHDQRTEKRADRISLYEQDVYSDELKIMGKCDLLEANKDEKGTLLPLAPFPVTLYPVEFKHGNVREEEEYKIQLCAQAMCLEEMFQTHIPEGALFFTSSHRRLPVSLDETLRNRTKEIIASVRKIKEDFILPPPEYGPKCQKCSVKDACSPKTKRSAASYCQKLCQEAKEMPSLEETS